MPRISALLCVCIFVILTVASLRLYRQPVKKPPTVPVSVSPAAVRVNAKGQTCRPTTRQATAKASAVVATICGNDPVTADRYEARNDALRSIARRRDLSPNDIALLMAYVGSTNDTLRAERTASLKNDVLNLLRSQNPVPAGLTELLVGMFRTGNHPPAVLDYCLQHLGAMQEYMADAPLRDRIRAVLVGAVKRIRFPYAGTALYSLVAPPEGIAFGEIPAGMNVSNTVELRNAGSVPVRISHLENLPFRFDSFDCTTFVSIFQWVAPCARGRNVLQLTQSGHKENGKRWSAMNTRVSSKRSARRRASARMVSRSVN